MVNPELVKEFIIAVKQDRGLELNEKQAAAVLDNWTKFFDLLAQIYHQERIAQSEEKGDLIKPGQ